MWVILKKQKKMKATKEIKSTKDSGLSLKIGHQSIIIFMSLIIRNHPVTFTLIISILTEEGKVNSRKKSVAFLPFYIDTREDSLSSKLLHQRILRLH